MLNGLGYPVSMMTRGDYLRSFDRDMVTEILNDLKQREVNIVQTSLPTSLKRKNDQIEVNIKNQKDGTETVDIFDTVLFAVGREATTDLLNLKKLGVETHKNKKIITT